MTPMETARKIVSETFDHYEWSDDKDPGTLIADIAAAIQHESQAQLDRDRDVVEAAKKACQIHHDAWTSADGERCVLLEQAKHNREIIAGQKELIGNLYRIIADGAKANG